MRQGRWFVNGMIEWFARNSVAANLMMAFIVVSGLLGATSTREEAFPEMELDRIQVRDVDDLLPARELADDRLLGLDRERGDGVDVALDLVDEPAPVRAEVELDHDGAHPLGRRRLDALDAVDALDRLLDADVHALLDLLRGGAQVRDLGSPATSTRSP